MAEIAQTADHALRILLELGNGEPLSPAVLAERLDLNRTVVHRLLATLAARGFVSRYGSLYRPGPTLIRLAKVIQPDLRLIAAPVLEALAQQTGESAVLHVPDNQDAVVLDQAVSNRHIVQVNHEIGSRHSLAVSASGRAILAYSEPALIKLMTRNSDQPAGLERTLEAVRQLGYSTSHDELQQGVHGVAVPILTPDNTPLGSLAVLTPVIRSTGIEQYIDALLAGAKQITAALFAGPSDEG
ncbi:IclR family transcriptional regulator [Nocardia sp. NPDC059239]|uniref:IclR family transcriptional regulator n=1 Tax=unclassified Nocardia TaxID=2637762 RepID=UPI003680DB90